MAKHISQNLHEFNTRNHDKLNSMIIEKEHLLKETKKLLTKLKLKNEIRKLHQQLMIIGEEIISFENQESSF